MTSSCFPFLMPSRLCNSFPPYVKTVSWPARISSLSWPRPTRRVPTCREVSLMIPVHGWVAIFPPAPPPSVQLHSVLFGRQLSTRARLTFPRPPPFPVSPPASPIHYMAALAPAVCVSPIFFSGFSLPNIFCALWPARRVFVVSIRSGDYERAVDRSIVPSSQCPSQ